MFIHAIFGTIFLLLFIAAITTHMWWLPFSILVIIALSATWQRKRVLPPQPTGLYTEVEEPEEPETKDTELTDHTLDEDQQQSDLLS